MNKEQRRTAKRHFMAKMQEDSAFQVAAIQAGLQISQSQAYRLMKAVRERGEVALFDERHGHPSKLRGAAQAFLEERCRQAPQTPSSTIQMELRERFDLCVSISQINRVRAALGISNHRKSQQQEKKQREREALFLNQNGKKVLGVCCYSLLPVRRNCFLNWR